MKEEAIARGEEFSEEESTEVDEDPGNIPHGDSASVLTHVSHLLSCSLDYQQLRCYSRSCGCKRSYCRFK